MATFIGYYYFINFYATLYDSQLRINYSNYVSSMFEVGQA